MKRFLLPLLVCVLLPTVAVLLLGGLLSGCERRGEVIVLDGEEMMGLSTKSPLFQAMSGKKKGDTFSHNNTTYKIRDVF